MNVFEMEGFLRGKCVPRDLKVNETNAEYLVRKFDALEAKCETLAAENAAMHEAIEAVRSVADNSSGIAGWHLNGDIATWEEILPEINDIETPATDAFLAEVRAQGVEMFSEKFGGGTPLSNMVKEVAADFAAKLRKGGNQ
ncbi:TPA: hypothetical protein ACUKFZ_003871 [Escherichia coli]